MKKKDVHKYLEITKDFLKKNENLDKEEKKKMKKALDESIDLLYGSRKERFLNSINRKIKKDFCVSSESCEECLKSHPFFCEVEIPIYEVMKIIKDDGGRKND